MVVGAQAGCKEEPKPTASGSSSASAPPDTTMDLPPQVKAAIAAASASAARGKGDAPPETGVFGPGEADTVHPASRPATLRIGAEGGEPRVSLVPVNPMFKGNAKVTVAIRTGPRNALPTAEFFVEMAPEKADAKAPAGAAQPPAIIVKVKKIEMSSEQLGVVSPEAKKEIEKLKGSQLRIVLGPEGGAGDVTIELAKGAAPDLERVVVTLADALLTLYAPMPAKPVGVGAVWIAESRNSYSGVDLVSYRMYRVTEVSGDDVTISIELKQYAAGPNLRFAGLPPDALLQQFDSLGAGEFKLHKGEAFPKEGRFAQQLALGIPAAGQSAGRLMQLSLQSNSLLSR